MQRRDGEGITDLLERWKSGEREVENRLAELIYPVLRAQAQAQVNRSPDGFTLCATELAHEAYERLAEQKSVDWRNREHFFAIAATVLRRVVIDYLRQRSAEKRGGLSLVVPLHEVDTDGAPAEDRVIDWLEMDQALTELGQVDPELLRVTELRVFGGLDVETIADVLNASVRTVGRRWRVARAWLAERLSLDDGR